VKILTLVRHTAPLVARGICYGQLDLDVAHSFAAEAAAIRHSLSPPDLIVSSPLLRTRKLGKFLAREYGCELRDDARLMEMHFGDWEGRAWHDIARAEIEAWSADVQNFAPPNGESAQCVMSRVQAMLQDLALLPQRHIVLVAHGGSIKAVLAQLAGIPLAVTLGWQIDYGSVIVVRDDFARKAEARC
jgi:alpha-ribazole phosphatase